MDLQTCKALMRITNSDDGAIFLEFLENLSKENYKFLKYGSSELRDIYAGKAQAIDEIKDFLINAEKESREKTKTDSSDWSL